MKPRPYQLVGRDFLAGRTRALLADEMRVGKTPQAILAAERFDFNNILVVCPAVATVGWQREWVSWAGRGSQVIGRDPMTSAVSVCSYDMAVRWKDVLTARRWDLVIFDESHYLKNPGAARTRAALAKGGIAYSADRIWCLTGTPMPKDASEVWVMLRSFGLTNMSYVEWTDRYCHLHPITKRITGNNKATVGEVSALLAQCTLRRTRAEVAPDMPDITTAPLFLKPKRQAPQYDLPVGATDEQLLAWLAAQGPNQASTRTEVAMAKVEPLADLILDEFAEGGLTATVVFGYHIPPMNEMLRCLVDGGLRVAVIKGDVSVSERIRICDAFRRGELDVVIVQVVAGGVAIDLSAARHAYALEIDWVPGTNWQAWNRLINMEKPDPVSIDIATLPGTVDEAINRVVARRAAEVNAVI